MTSLGDRIKTLESKYPDEASEYTIECILSWLDDKDLDLMERAAKLRETGLTESEVDERLTEQGKFYKYQKALARFRQINADLIE